MERRLLLLRHLKSSWDDPVPDDFDRPLSTRGLNAASVVGDQIRECGVVPDLVVCSPSKRTVSTLELAILPLFPSILVRFERRIYEATPDGLMDVIRETSSDVANVTFIGHNPAMELTAVHLTASHGGPERRRMLEKFPTGAAALIGFTSDTWEEAVEMGGRLMSFTTPREMAGSQK